MDTGIKTSIKTIDIVYMAMGIVLMAVCSWISIPTVIPFSFQTFGVFMVLCLLGGSRGTLSIAGYIILGIVGFPVFTGFNGGPGVIFGATGGYIAGFVIMGLVYMLFERVFHDRLYCKILSMLAGLFLCYAFGTAWFMIMYARSAGEAGLLTVLGWCVFPFIVPDLLKLALALMLSERIKKYTGKL